LPMECQVPSKDARRSMTAWIYRRYAWWCLALIFLTIPLGLRGARHAVQGMKNDVRNWLPASFQETGELAWFRDQFLEDQFIIISWPGCQGGEDDRRFQTFVQRLEEDAQRGNARLFTRVTSGPQVLNQLTREGAGLAQDVEEARRRLQGSLFGPDGKQTCLIVTLSSTGLQDLHRVVGRGLLGRPRGRIMEIADECGIAAEDFHVGGPPVDNVAIDEEGSITLVRLVGLCVVAGLGLAYLCLRNFLLMWMVFLVGGLSAVLAMATVYWTGGYVDAVLMTMPALVYVLALSGAIHIVNYYRDALVEGCSMEDAPGQAAAHGWLPCTLCAVTTSLGMFSLCTSEIQPIRNFGFYSGVGVLIGLGVLLVYLPAALQVFRPRIRPHDLERGLGFISFPESLWARYARGIVRYRRWIVGICLVGIVWLMAGATRIQTSVDILKLFDAQAKIIEDYTWFERHLGKLVPLELVVQVPPSQLRPSIAELAAMETPERREAARQLSMLERVELTSTVQRAIDARFGQQGQDIVGQTLSAATFAPELPEPGGTLNSATYRSAINHELEKHRQELLDTEYLRIDTGERSELWRISLRVAALQNVDYGLFVEQLREVVEPILDAYNSRYAVLEKLQRLRGEQGIGGATVGILHVSNRPTASEASQHTVTSWIRSANSATSMGDEELSQSDRPSYLVDALQAARLRIGSQELSLEELPEQLAIWLAECDLVVIEGHGLALPELSEQQSDRVLMRDDRDNGMSTPDHPEISAIYTGIIPLVFKAQRTLLKNLVESTGWSILLVSICMMIVLCPGKTWRERIRIANLCQGILAGMISMLPNVFPLVLVFGLIGWLGIPVDIGTMMTAGVALGIAVDDTIHYLTWFRWGLDDGQSSPLALQTAFQRCGNAMMQTTILGGLGMFVFAASTFSPTQRFGTMMLALLAAALVGDLVWGPALYAGWCGRFFRHLPFQKDVVQSDRYEDPGTNDVDRQPDLEVTDFRNRGQQQGGGQ
jgi:uncharacterized protein